MNFLAYGLDETFILAASNALRPVSEIGDLALFERNRQADVVHQHRHQNLAVHAFQCFVLDPAGEDGSLRPDNKHAGRQLDLRIDCFFESISRCQLSIPPDGESFLLQCGNQRLYSANVFPGIADENVRQFRRR